MMKLTGMYGLMRNMIYILRRNSTSFIRNLEIIY
jgi:hypothetical protein